ncbi:VWA domain-containing protein [Streptococcus gallolyticus]|nr:VWA domain-containing protein [Streptococcus gallolyticus]MBY5040588.1 VWA domain-containing protein [Streptococcus gallolyticus]
MKHAKRGFTLVELLISISLIAVVTLVLGVISQTVFASKDLVDKEATIQAEVRTSMQAVDKSVQNATAIFVLDDSKYDGDTKNMKSGWSYIGLTKDKKNLVNFSWNKAKNTWDEVKLGNRHFYDITMDLKFSSDDNYQDNRLVNYQVKGQYTNTNKKFALDSASVALNTKQVFSHVSRGKEGVAIAYRNDPIEGQMNTAISFVFDTSGSMGWDINGKNVTHGDPANVRMTILKDKAKNMIDELTDLGNVSVNLVQFSTLGGYIQEEFVDLKSGSNTIKQNIQNMTPEGGTNPGDGLRHAMVSLQKNPAQFKYVVLLTDGVPNIYTVGEYRYKQLRPRYRDVYDYIDPKFDLSNKVGKDSSKDFYYGTGEFLQEAVTYTQKVSKTFGKGVRRVSMIGFSGVASEKAYGQALTKGIKNDHVDANYYDASNKEELAKVFSDIKKQIEQDLWFVVGP